MPTTQCTALKKSGEGFYFHENDRVIASQASVGQNITLPPLDWAEVVLGALALHFSSPFNDCSWPIADIWAGVVTLNEIWPILMLV